MGVWRTTLIVVRRKTAKRRFSRRIMLIGTNGGHSSEKSNSALGVR